MSNMTKGIIILIITLGIVIITEIIISGVY